MTYLQPMCDLLLYCHTPHQTGRLPSCACRPCCIPFPVRVDAQQAAVPQAYGGGVCCCGGYLWQHGHHGVSEKRLISQCRSLLAVKPVLFMGL
jgi:hypothetical protein